MGFTIRCCHRPFHGLNFWRVSGPWAHVRPFGGLCLSYVGLMLGHFGVIVGLFSGHAGLMLGNEVQMAQHERSIANEIAPKKRTPLNVKFYSKRRAPLLPIVGPFGGHGGPFAVLQPLLRPVISIPLKPVSDPVWTTCWAMLGLLSWSILGAKLCHVRPFGCHVHLRAPWGNIWGMLGLLTAAQPSLDGCPWQGQNNTCQTMTSTQRFCSMCLRVLWHKWQESLKAARSSDSWVFQMNSVWAGLECMGCANCLELSLLPCFHYLVLALLQPSCSVWPFDGWENCWRVPQVCGLDETLCHRDVVTDTLCWFVCPFLWSLSYVPCNLACKSGSGDFPFEMNEGRRLPWDAGIRINTQRYAGTTLWAPKLHSTAVRFQLPMVRFCTVYACWVTQDVSSSRTSCWAWLFRLRCCTAWLQLGTCALVCIRPSGCHASLVCA